MIVGRTLKPRLACAALLACAGAPAAAQYGSAPAPPPPPRMENNGSTSQDGDTQIVPATPTLLLTGAGCLIRARANAGDALLATAPHSREERTLAVRMLGDMQRCLRQRAAIGTSAVLLRGAIAEAVYEARFATPQAAANPAVPVKPVLQPARITGGIDAAAIAPEYALAECAAAGQPALVIALLQTEPGSASAQTAFQAMAPAYRACLPPAARISVDGRTIRGVLAEALYRWSVVQRDGATSAWAAAPAAPAATAAATPAAQ